jgi:hypothetical protein
MTLELIIFKLGYVGDLDLNRVANLINVNSKAIQAKVGDPVHNIETPDVYGFAYSRASLFKLYPKINNTVKIGVVISPIEGNFYSITNDKDCVLITRYQTDEVCEKAGRTFEEYVGLSVVMEVLWLQYKSQIPEAGYNDLFHEQTRGCIFDFAGHKPDKVHKLKTCQIDTICRGQFVSANVSESTLKTFEKILENIKRPNFIGALVRSMQHPIFSFVFGGLVFGLIINTVTSMLLGDFDSTADYYVFGILLSLPIVMAIGNYVLALIENTRKDVS